MSCSCWKDTVLSWVLINIFMTKKLSELFDLPVDEEVAELSADEPNIMEVITSETLSNLDKIDTALPGVRGLEASDTEMDDLAKMAVESYKDLMDLGMNVEARLAKDILSSASQFLGHAITAKDAKINKKIKMIELQLKKAKLDQDTTEPEETAQGQILDRNELLAEVLKQVDQNKDSE